MAENQLAPPKEVWKDVPGYEGIYSVSTTGLIKNYGRLIVNNGGREKPKLLKPRKDEKGYLRISLVDKNGVRTFWGIHRIVATTFIPNPDSKPFIDHINGVKDDNRVDNLRWCTTLENTHNPITYSKYLKAMESQRGKTFSDEHRRKLSEGRKGKHASAETRALQSKIKTESAKPILQLSLNGELIKEWKSSLEISKQLGIDRSAIYKCIKGKLHKTGGFKWKFK
jgi:hypothetical protein